MPTRAHHEVAAEAPEDVPVAAGGEVAAAGVERGAAARGEQPVELHLPLRQLRRAQTRRRLPTRPGIGIIL